MFHEGDLHSGVAQALAEAKLVACFLRGKLILDSCSQVLVLTCCSTDDSAQSDIWEYDFLKDNEVHTAQPRDHGYA